MTSHARLGGRPKSIVAAQTARPQSYHCEPLLFLYPRWFSTAVTRENRQPSLWAQSRLQSEEAKRSKKTSKKDAQEHGIPRRPISSTKDEQPEQKEELEQEVAQAEQRGASVNSPPSTRLVRRLVGKVTNQENKAARKIQLRSSHSDFSDWQTPFQELKRRTPKGAGHHVRHTEQLKMPEGMQGCFPGDLKTHLLEIHLMTDCTVQISSGCSDDTGKFWSLDLTGTPEAIGAARERLKDTIKVVSPEDLNAVHSMRVYLLPASTTTSSAALRSVFAKNVVRAEGPRTAESVTVPERWTITSLTNHVHDLTSMQMPRLWRQKLYGLQPGLKLQHSHVNAVTKTLLDLLSDPSKASIISMRACTDAIRFLYKYNKLPEVRQLIEALDNNEFGFSTRILNVCLQSAKDNGDLRAFRLFLTIMSERRIKPDGESWTSLIALVHQRKPNTKFARDILSTMRTRGLLTPAARKDVARTFIDQDFTAWIASGRSTSDFVVHYDRLWESEDWLGSGTANRMISSRVARGQLDDAFDILQTLESRDGKPTTVTLNTILSAAADQLNFKAGMESLKLLHRHPKLGLDDNTYLQLFLLAWRQHRPRYNFLRVIWHYACMDGHVSFKLTALLEKYIIRDVPEMNSVRKRPRPIIDGANSGADQVVSKREQRHILAAKAVLGLPTGDSNGLEHVRKVFKLRKAGMEAPVDESIEDCTARSKSRVKALLDILHADTRQVGTLQAAKPLLEMVELANATDEEWIKNGIMVEPDLTWILRNIIDIPVVFRQEKVLELPAAVESAGQTSVEALQSNDHV